MVGRHGRTERLLKPNTLHELEYLFTNVYNSKNTLHDFIKHVRPLQMGTHDTLQPRIESILASVTWLKPEEKGERVMG